MINWNLLPLEKYFDEYASIWDELNQRLNNNHPLLSSKFVGPLVKYFSNANDVMAIAKDGQKTKAIIPLSPTGIGRWGSFRPGQAPISPMLLEPDIKINHLFKLITGPACLIDFFRQDSLFSCISETANQLTTEIAPNICTINIAIEDDFKKYWEERTGKLRKSLRRLMKKAEQESFEVSLKVHQDPDEIESALERYGEIESRGWKGTAGSAIHKDNTQGRFYKDVLLGFSEKKCATVYELYFSDQLVASLLSIRSETMLVSLKTTYDEKFSSFGPGRILRYHFLNKEFDTSNVKTVELYTNADKAQMEWGTGVRWINHISVYRWFWIPQVVGGLRTLRKALPKS